VPRARRGGGAGPDVAVAHAAVLAYDSPVSAPDRNLALELVRVTEAAAMAAARWIGRGEKESADQAAVDAMRGVLDTVAMAGVVDIEASPGDNVRRVAEAKGVDPTDISVVVLDRDRHQALIAELRAVGAKVRLITDGDVAPAIAAAREGTVVDMLMGVGGTPE